MPQTTATEFLPDRFCVVRTRAPRAFTGHSEVASSWFKGLQFHEAIDQLRSPRNASECG